MRYRSSGCWGSRSSTPIYQSVLQFLAHLLELERLGLVGSRQSPTQAGWHPPRSSHRVGVRGAGACCGWGGMQHGVEVAARLGVGAAVSTVGRHCTRRLGGGVGFGMACFGAAVWHIRHSVSWRLGAFGRLVPEFVRLAAMCGCCARVVWGPHSSARCLGPRVLGQGAAWRLWCNAWLGLGVQGSRLVWMCLG